MLLPARMRRIEILVPKDSFDATLQYLRESRFIELIDVKEFLRSYEGAINPNQVSDRLYRLVSLSTKISNLLQTLKAPPPAHARPVPVRPELSDDDLRKIETQVSALDSQVSTAIEELQSLEKLVDFAEVGLRKSAEELSEIEDAETPEGRKRLEEILDQIFEALSPPELEEARRLSADIKERSIEEAIKAAVVEELSKVLRSNKDEIALLGALDEAFNLKLKAELRSRKLTYDVQSRVEKAKERIAQLRRQLEELTAKNSSPLRVYAEQVDADRVVEEARGLTGRTETTTLIEGWIPAEYVKMTEQEISRITRGRCLVNSWPARGGPTKLENPKSTGIFEKLTMGFGVPQTEEIDPTVLWLVTYPIFFGLMFGDVGHGLLVVLASSVIYLMKRRGLRFDDASFQGLGGIFNLVIQGSPLLILSGFSAIIAGFLYGSFLGSENWFKELTGLNGPLWFSPFENLTRMLRVSMTIGVIHIISGLVLDLVNKARHHEWLEVLAGPATWLLFYASFGYQLLSKGLRLPAWLFGNPFEVFFYIGIPMMLMLASRLYADGPMGAMHWFESMLASLSHTLSYVRILAMKIIHDVFSLLFLLLLGSVTASVSGLVGIFVGWSAFSILTVLMILLLETAFVFMQSLRLHWVEWFLKFYAGSGVSFKPFGIQRTYTTLVSSG